MVYFYLFIEFFKIGLFAMGGGMATVPFLIELTTRYDWYTTSEFANFVAISQSTPGPVGINMATYAGYQAGGLLGAIVAPLSLVLPSLIIIMLIAQFMKNFNDNKYVKAVFKGIRPTVSALILFAVIELCKLSLFVLKDNNSLTPDLTNIGLCLIILVCINLKYFKKCHPLVWVALGGVLGIIFKL